MPSTNESGSVRATDTPLHSPTQRHHHHQRSQVPVGSDRRHTRSTGNAQQHQRSPASLIARHVRRLG